MGAIGCMGLILDSFPQDYWDSHRGELAGYHGATRLQAKLPQMDGKAAETSLSQAEHRGLRSAGGEAQWVVATVGIVDAG